MPIDWFCWRAFKTTLINIQGLFPSINISILFLTSVQNKKCQTNNITSLFTVQIQPSITPGYGIPDLFIWFWLVFLFYKQFHYLFSFLNDPVGGSNFQLLYILKYYWNWKLNLIFFLWTYRKLIYNLVQNLIYSYTIDIIKFNYRFRSIFPFVTNKRELKL